MLETRQRHPDPCPRHPENLIFKSTQHSSDSVEFTQRHCAHDGCDQKTGWYIQEHSGQKSFRHGPDECQDPDVLHTVAVASHQQKYREISIFFLLLGTATIFVAGFVS